MRETAMRETEDFLTTPYRMTILSHRADRRLDATKEVWDKALSFFDTTNRKHITYAASHGYTVIEEDEGIIAVISPVSQEDGEIFYQYGEEESHYFSLSGDNLSTRVAYIQSLEATT